MACVDLNQRGDPCRYKTAPDAVYCPNHDPKNTAALSERNTASARRPRPRPRPSHRLLDASLALTDRASVARMSGIRSRTVTPTSVKQSWH